MRMLRGLSPSGTEGSGSVLLVLLQDGGVVVHRQILAITNCRLFNLQFVTMDIWIRIVGQLKQS